MRSNQLLPALGASLLFLTACLAGCGPAPVCKAGETRSCYSGPDGTAGVGSCKRGTQTCRNDAWSKCEGEVLPSAELCDSKDNNCNGQVDEGVKNACGGCLLLESIPGEPCADCGKMACDGTDAVRCIPPAQLPGSDCTGASGCAGKNVCQNNAVHCEAPDKNECELCGGPAVAGLGNSCTSADGCKGVLVCSATNDSAVCNALPKNACGVCGGPVVTGVNTTCRSGSCSGTNVCNPAGTGVICQAPGANECGVCGGAPVPGLNQSCTGANGCGGTTSCNTAGTGTSCVAPPKNNCGACGAADVPNVNGSCTASNTCSGKVSCSTDGLSGVCTASQSPNECGLCGGAPVTGLGNACTSAAGCSGQLACDTAKTGTVCNAPAANNCGACGAANVANIGQVCTSAAGCAGVYQCDAAKTGSVCNAPASCAAVGHVVISEISPGTNANSTDEFIELYNPTSAAIDISFYSLWYRAATTAGTILDAGPTGGFPAGTKIGAHGYLLVARITTYTGTVTADFTYPLGTDLSMKNGSVWLLNVSTKPASTILPTDATVVDMVGWGSTANNKFEGTATAVAPPIDTVNTTASIERKAIATSTQASMASGGPDANKGNGYDSDNSGFDWLPRLARDPKNLASPPAP